jgi:hypothetical protein
MRLSKFEQQSNTTKTLITGTKLYEVYVENGEIKLPMENQHVTIGYTAEYIKYATELINNNDVAYTRIENDWYGDGKQVKFYGRDSRGISKLMGWIDNKLNFMFKKGVYSPLSPTESK